MERSRRRRIPLVALTLALLSLGGGLVQVALAAESPAASAHDPVLAEIVRLLEAGIGEPVVLRWLEESGKRPGPPSVDDLVALKHAGATDPLLAELLNRSRADSPAPAAAPDSPAAAPQVTATAPERLAPPAAGTPVAVAVSLRYVHVVEEGEAWDFVAYLDGEALGPIAAAPNAEHARTWTIEHALAPGPHLLRWAQERHGKRSGERGLHAARFDPEPLRFELAPGDAATIEIEYRDRSGPFLRFGDPMTVRVAQSGKELASRHDSRGDPADWPLLCEEIEANLGGAKPGFDDRRELRSCARWADLWRDVPSAPSRDQVRPTAR